MNSEYFNRFQQMCIGILAESDNCQESQQMFREAQTVPELVTAWQHFWAGVLNEVPEQVIASFAELYPTYRDDIRKAGVAYNEPLDDGMILVGDPPEDDSQQELILGGRPRVYVLGAMPLVCKDNCNVHINADRADVTLCGNCRGNIDKGTVVVRDRSAINGRGTITCYDSTTVLITGGTLRDHGHNFIKAYNDAEVHSFTSRRITICDSAKLIID